ncbi:sulfurtransferase complex subunit TusC [Aliagarivorans marinus]|uniref:sulfurtransferase complex subunit TusC n=1 Tax=Aliagarivorans marinus TaxID=561965 RepID=UPI00041DF61A|nr:sulfurtransferase complex subunit TusC [Aliagarivorans marinus]
MSKPLVWIMASAPHQSANAREGLDAILAASAVSEDVVVYFDGDGVWQLLAGQQPEQIRQRHILPTYGMLDLYDVEQLFINPDALAERGLELGDLSIQPESLTRQAFLQRFATSHAMLRF